MPSFTRQAIMDAFLRLLAHKPFRKVTVRDIVEECGVNRTTFYYYYQDMYAIVEDLVASMLAPYAAALVGQGVEEDLRDAADFVRMHRRALLGLWEGLGQEAVRRYLFSVLDGPLGQMVARDAEGLSVTPEERETVRILMRENLFGYFYLYLRGELPTGIGTLEAATRGTSRGMLKNIEDARKGGKPL